MSDYQPTQSSELKYAQQLSAEVKARVLPITEESLKLAAFLIRSGQLVVVPTDTVYGVAADPANAHAVERIFAAKHRPRAKSIQVLLDSLERLPQLHLSLPQPLDRLSAALLPGGFSPIAQARESTPLATVRREEDGSLTQAIRVPDSDALHAITAVTGPLAATSANLSGEESATSAWQAAAALGDSVALYLDAGPTPGPVASTVVKAAPGAALGIDVLREGVISRSRLAEIISYPQQ